jgi:alpha-glucoside transport system permease protein
MAVIDDAIDVVPVPEPAAPVQPRSELPRAPIFTVNNVFRVLVFGALAAFLLYYVGPRSIAQTTLKVAFAVALTIALWVGANLLFDQAYGHWTRFNTILGFAVGFLGYFLAEANGSLRTLTDNEVRLPGQGLFDSITGWNTGKLDFNGFLWALIGGAALALVMFLLSAPRQQLARLPLSVVGWVAFGLLTSFALAESVWPALDWGKLLISAVVGAGLFALFGLWRYGVAAAPLSALTGACVGWFIGAWGGADIGAGSRGEVILATVVPAAILGVRFGLATEPDPTKRRRIDQRSRSWIFLTPALAFIAVGLLVPLIRSIYLSFRNRNGKQSVGWDNYKSIFGIGKPNTKSFDITHWRDIFTSQLWWTALVIILIGVLAGVFAGRRTSQRFERGPASVGVIMVGFFILSIAVLSVLRGTIFNNIWWVIVVVTVSTAVGLAVAVLADRAKAENAAKSLIFLPMAISFIGAGIIWRFMYQARDPSQNQTGVLNAIWVWLGQVSNSNSKWIAALVLGLVAVGLGYLIMRGVQAKTTAMAMVSAGLLLVVAYLIFRFLGPGLGGFVESDGKVESKPILFLQEPPFNNMWLMVILIWVQVGFAMVILSAAIKAVPTELTEAAKIDGATESQVFWKITLPQIAPTVGVVVTALFVTVMKVFDIVYATTNGNFGTQVIANQMFQSAFAQSNLGLGSALAIVLFISVIPVMWINIRRIQRDAAA